MNAQASYHESCGRPIDTVIERLEAVKARGRGYIARCPAHNDGRPSLKIDIADDDRVLLHCYAGCSTQSVVEAIDLKLSDLFVPSAKPGPRLLTDSSRIIYDYQNADGSLAFQVIRDPGKQFRQRWPDGHGGWIYNLDDLEPPLHHLPELNAEPTRWAALTEGEKDSDRLRSIGLLATTAPRGAAYPWRESFTRTLLGHPVVIFVDNDQPGRKCALERARILYAAGIKVKVILLPDLPDKGDVSDWLDAGNDKAALIRVMTDTPLWTPDLEEPAPEPMERPQSRAVVLSMDSVKPKAIDWFWERWLARGKLHLLGGHPGDGKSTITLALASTFSRGGLLPDGSRAPICNVLLVLAEDDLEDTVRPRIDLHRGDPAKIWAIRMIKDEKDVDRALSLSAHVNEMRAVIEAYHIDIVIVDPITSYLPKADRNAEGDVRDALMPFTSLIEQTSVAALGVMHVGKGGSQGKTPLQQLLGSTAFGAMARLVWMTAELPEEEQPPVGEDGLRETRKLLGVVKTNVSMRPPAIEWTRPLDGPIRWLGESKFRIDDVMAGVAENPIVTAKTFLEELLKGGSKPANDILELAKDADISQKTLRRAKADLKIETFKETGTSVGRWFWRLPSGVKASEPVATFHNIQSAEDGHPDDVTTFPEPSEDGHIADDDHLPNYPKGTKEDGHLAYIGKVAIFPTELEEGEVVF